MVEARFYCRPDHPSKQGHVAAQGCTHAIVAIPCCAAVAIIKRDFAFSKWYLKRREKLSFRELGGSLETHRATPPRDTKKVT